MNGVVEVEGVPAQAETGDEEDKAAGWYFSALHFVLSTSLAFD